MNDAILIQVSSEAQHAKHLGLYYDRHLEYCARHGFDYWTHVGPVRFCDHLAWSKLVLASQAMIQGYSYIAYLDTDAFIADTAVDLRDACVTAINSVRWNVPLSHLQAGVLFFNNGLGYAKAILDFLLQESKYYLEVYPDLRGWFEQGQLNDFAKIPGNERHINTLGVKWNYNQQLCGPLPTGESPVILAWHGIAEPARTTEIRDTLAALRKAEQNALRAAEETRGQTSTEEIK
jgi:hypothetical protein